MPRWLQAVLLALALVVLSWLLLIVLARRLPPGGRRISPASSRTA